MACRRARNASSAEWIPLRTVSTSRSSPSEYRSFAYCTRRSIRRCASLSSMRRSAAQHRRRNSSSASSSLCPPCELASTASIPASALRIFSRWRCFITTHMFPPTECLAQSCSQLFAAPTVTNFTLDAFALVRAALKRASPSGDTADVARLSYVGFPPGVQIVRAAVVEAVVLHAPQLVRTLLLFSAENRAVPAHAQHPECDHRNPAKSERHPHMQAPQQRRDQLVCRQQALRVHEPRPGKLRDKREHRRRFARLEKRVVGKDQREWQLYPRSRLEQNGELPGDERHEVQHWQQAGEHN